MTTVDEKIKSYLSELKSALKGADKATIQDALADAEEHLRNALTNELEGTEQADEAEILQGVINEYGTPGEIAEVYRNWELSKPPSLVRTGSAKAQGKTGSKPGQRYSGFFRVFIDPRAWGGLVFMLISLVTGTLYFSWTVTALSTSIGVMILIIGIPVTILFLLSIRGLAYLEGRLVEALLGERMPRRPAFTNPDLGWIERLKQLLLGKTTWLAVVYNLLMLPLGSLYFSIAVTLLATSLAFIAAPILSIVFQLPVAQFGANQYSIPDYLTPLVTIGGALLLTLTMHLARWTGWVHGRFAKALLVSD